MEGSAWFYFFLRLTRYACASIRIRYSWVENGLRGQRGGIYSTSTPCTLYSLSNGHLAGIARTQRSASSGVQDTGSSHGKFHFGNDAVNRPHHRGGRVRDILRLSRFLRSSIGAKFRKRSEGIVIKRWIGYNSR